MVALGSAKDGDVYIFYTPDPDVRAGVNRFLYHSAQLPPGTQKSAVGDWDNAST